MIRIDFSFTAAAYLFLLILVVIGHWMYYTNIREGGGQKSNKDPEHIHQCPYCTHIFANYQPQANVIICPKCKSYIKSEP